ncbi:MAG: citrate/2-methylcitrate synthase, partial [Lentisphaeria bacterium]|nr:citrate/2-methylcitrate synthase [Lentisphaeria bacterium]
MATATQSATTKLELNGEPIELPIVVGTEQEHAVDISKLRFATGYITLDDGYGNTGSCQSSICFINGETGILRYRGIPIEQLAEHSSFVETAMLLINGDLPVASELERFRGLLKQHQMLHEKLRSHYNGFPVNAHPMAILSAMINAVSCYHPDVMQMEDQTTFESAAARLMSKVRTIAASAYKTSIGEPPIFPKPDLNYCANFLHMLFSKPYADFEPPQEL